MKIEIGNYEILHSGHIIQFGDNPVRITLTDKVEGDYTIIFNFIKDDKEPNTVTRLRPEDKFTMNLDFVNFKGNNIGNVNLIHLGTLEKRNLFINYRVSELVGVGMTILFNFMTSKEVPNAH